jgi:hypothetical protein
VRKIPTIFIRDPDNPKRVTTEVDPDCQWVIDGDGIPTEKYDGSACLARSGSFYRRHRLKKEKSAPPGWVHWTFDPEHESGHGWAPVDHSTVDQYHREAWPDEGLPDGTYELVGPSLQKNPYYLRDHQLWPHGATQLSKASGRTYNAIGDWLSRARPMEGIVFHHPDGRMAKIKRRDFGLEWPVT